MRKLIVSSNLTLDGVMEAPQHWFGPYNSGDLAELVKSSLNETDALLLGRVTYDEFASYWPTQAPNESGFPQFLNSVAKYVASSTLQTSDWHNTTIISNIAEDVRNLKAQDGGNIVVLGSATLVRSLLQEDLIDAYELMVAPIVLGRGKRLFPDAIGQTLQFVGAKPFSAGVVLLRYQRKSVRMTKHVLFLQGAGDDAYDEDGKLAAYLRDALGNGYDVRYPRMPDADQAASETWKAQIADEIAAFDGEIMLVGHSFGGSMLLKYLSEATINKPIAGVFILATPFWNGDADWQYDGYALREGFATQLANIPHIFLYHSRDDDTVPFAHLGMYAAKLPQATVRAIDDRGHQFQNDLSEVVADIKGVTSTN